MTTRINILWTISALTLSLVAAPGCGDDEEDGGAAGSGGSTAGTAGTSSGGSPGGHAGAGAAGAPGGAGGAMGGHGGAMGGHGGAMGGHGGAMGGHGGAMGGHGGAMGGHGGAMGGHGGAMGGHGGAMGGHGGAMGGHGGAMGGHGGSGGAAAATCSGYCTTIMSNCADGTHQQYANQAQCEASCAAWEQGTTGATSGLNLECKNYHAGVANNDVHCYHAGPSGIGLCGSVCENYCRLQLEFCAANYPGGEAGCVSDCAFLTGDDATAYDQSMQSGDTVQCRIYHSTAAATDAATHCAHSGHTPSAGCT